MYKAFSINTLSYLLLIPIAISSNYVQAETEDTPNTNLFLAPLIVVGETTNTEVDSTEIKLQQASDLADVFRHIPAVSVGGSLGVAQKVYIRGLEDTLLNVTLDGAPQTGTLFHHTGRLSVDPELLKKVNVQAGAGEATAGAGAIGGAIHFETKDPEDMLAPGRQFGALLKTGYFSNEGHRESISVYGKLGDRVGVLASYVNSNQSDMEDGHGDQLKSTGSEQDLGFIKLKADLSTHQSAELTYEKREESGDFAQRPNWPEASWSPSYPINIERQTLTLNHQFKLNDLINLETTLYHTERELIQDVDDRWGKFSASLKSYGFDIRNTSQIDQHELIYGADLREDRVESRCLENLGNQCGSTNKTEEEGTILGLYLQDHYQLTDDLLLSFGVRYDNYELDQVTNGGVTESDGFSPNLGFRYDISDNLEFSLGHARAMRGKEVSDAFTLSGASIDDNLTAEKVENTEAALKYDNNNLSMRVSVYNSKIKDVIVDQLGQGTFYENAGSLRAKGYELQADYQWEKLLLSASFSHNDTRFNGDRVEGYEHNGLANSRGDSWNLSARYQHSQNLELGWNMTYVEDLDNVLVMQRATAIGWIGSPQAIDKAGYMVHDVYMTWRPLANDQFSVDLAMQNLFDEYYIDHSSVSNYGDIAGWEGVTGQAERGRDVRVNLSYRF